jgi:hypothetical protein
MIEQERILAKDLSFQYNKEIYQIESEYKRRLYGKKVQIYEIDGEIQKVIQNGNELKFQKWKEKVYTPTKIIDIKELETFSSRDKKKNNKHHPWKQENFLKKIGATSP